MQAFEQIDQAVQNKNWFAYSIQFGMSKISNGVRESVVVCNVYVFKNEPAVQVSFCAPTLPEAISHFQKWLCNIGYRQNEVKTETEMPSHKMRKQIEMFK